MNPLSSRVVAPAPAAATAGNNGMPVIWMLITLSLGIAFANLMIGQRAIVIHVQQQRKQHQESQLPHVRSSPIDEEHINQNLTKVYNSRVKIKGDGDENFVYDGEYITQILLGEEPFPSHHTSNISHPHRLKFLPGTLHLTHAEAFQHCFVNATHYAGHIQPQPQSLVSISHKYKLIYRNIVKSSSSSARHVMQDFFDGRDLRMKHEDMEKKVRRRRSHGQTGYTMISFIREPLSRFYSSYDEAYFRMGPWMGEGSIVHDKPKIRQMYRETEYKMDKYPYLYAGLHTIEEFRPYYCPKEILDTGFFLKCDEIPSIDNGTLTERFEKFVRDYSGLDPFDIHLTLQVTNIVFPNGQPFPISSLYNASEAEQGWKKIANSHGVEIPKGEMTVGRKKTRRINMSLISIGTKRKICRIMALDYCCLNIELPEVCREDFKYEDLDGELEGASNDDDDDDESVYCALERRNDKTMENALKPLVLHPWQDP